MTCVALSHDGSHVVSGSWDRTIRSWPLLEAKKPESLSMGLGWNTSALCMSANGKLVVSGNADGSIFVWSAETGALKNALFGHMSRIACITICSNGQYIVSGSEDDRKPIHIWDVAEGKQVGHPLHGHEGEITAVAISDDCTWIVSGSTDSTLRLWQLPTGRPIGNPLIGHSKAVSCVATSSGNRFIISGSHDGTILVWNVNSQKPVGKSLQHGAGIKSLYVS